MRRLSFERMNIMMDFYKNCTVRAVDRRSNEDHASVFSRNDGSAIDYCLVKIESRDLRLCQYVDHQCERFIRFAIYDNCCINVTLITITRVHNILKLWLRLPHADDRKCRVSESSTRCISILYALRSVSYLLLREKHVIFTVVVVPSYWTLSLLSLLLLYRQIIAMDISIIGYVVKAC